MRLPRITLGNVQGNVRGNVRGNDRTVATPKPKSAQETERACSNSDTRCSNSCEGGGDWGREKRKGGEGRIAQSPKAIQPIYDTVEHIVYP